MLIAIIYTFWVLGTGVTSSSWDTVTKLLALALALQNPAPEALRGSGAGVERLGTYRRVVRLRARMEEGGEQERAKEKLVLIVGGEEVSGRMRAAMDVGQDGVTYRRVVVDEEYPRCNDVLDRNETVLTQMKMNETNSVVRTRC